MSETGKWIWDLLQGLSGLAFTFQVILRFFPKLITYLQLWARQWNFKGEAIPDIWFVATS